MDSTFKFKIIFFFKNQADPTEFYTCNTGLWVSPLHARNALPATSGHAPDASTDGVQSGSPRPGSGHP